MNLDLCGGFDSTVRAADSSSRGIGGVQTKVSVSVVLDILRTAPKLRGFLTCLDGIIAPAEDVAAEQPMILAQKFFWTETLGSRAKTPSGRYAVHINVTEMLVSRLMAEQASRNLGSLHTVRHLDRHQGGCRLHQQGAQFVGPAESRAPSDLRAQPCGQR